MAEPRVRIRLEADSSGAEAGVSRAEASLGRLNTFLRDRLVATFGDVANASRIALEAVGDFAESEAKLGALEIRLADQGVALDQFLAKLNEVAAGTVSNADLVRSASEALIRGLPADQIVNVLAVARQQAVVTGNTVSETFAALVRAITSASQEQLAALGINVSLREELSNLAADTGLSADQFDSAKRALVAWNVVAAQGVPTGEQLARAQQGISVAMEKFNSGLSNLKEFLAGATVALVQFGRGFTDFVVGAFAKGAQAILRSFELIVEGAASLPFVGEKFKDLEGRLESARIATEKFADDWLKTSSRLKSEALDILSQMGERLGLLKGNAQEAGDRIQSVNNNFTSVAATAREAGQAGSAGMDAIKQAAEDAAAQLEATRVSADNARVGFSALGAQAATAAAQVRSLTAAQFDAIEASQGVGAATQAALDAGGRLTQGGARVRLAGGGSRLTSSFGFGSRGSSSFATISGGTFSVTRPSQPVSSDGRIGG